MYMHIILLYKCVSVHLYIYIYQLHIPIDGEVYDHKYISYTLGIIYKFTLSRSLYFSNQDHNSEVRPEYGTDICKTD